MTRGGRLRVGVLGCGFIARTYHVPALQQVEEAEIVAFANPTLSRAVALAETVGLDQDACTTDPHTVIERDDVDAVLILSPNDTHRDLAVAAARAGKSALVQKPLARTAAECREMIEAARSAGTVLAAAFPHRYFPEVRLARDYLRKGAIGRLTAIRVRNAGSGSTWSRWFHEAARTGGGAGLDLGVHGIDLFRFWGGEVLEVQSRLAMHVPERPMADAPPMAADNEDNMLALYGLRAGASGSHEVSWTERSPGRRFTALLQGDSGTILVRSGFGPLAIASRRLDNGGQWILPFVAFEPTGVREHRAFVEAALGRAPLDATAEDGLAALQVVEAIYRSARQGGARVAVAGAAV